LGSPRRDPARLQRKLECGLDQVRRHRAEKINGKYWMYWLGTAADKTDQMGLSYSTDLIHWTESDRHAGAAAPPGKI